MEHTQRGNKHVQRTGKQLPSDHKILKKESILDVRTHSTETFQYTHLSSYHPLGVRKSFIKGDALRLLRTNSSKAIFEENIKKFK